MQKKEEKNVVLDPKVYYRSLTKKEKGKLLYYISVRYGVNTQTFLRKLRGYNNMKPMEEEIVRQVISTGVWRG